MQQIADWLKKLDIDVTVLPDFTDQHLKDLGISRGYRLRAMRDLGNPLVVGAAPSGRPATEPTRTRGPCWVPRYRSPLPTP